MKFFRLSPVIKPKAILVAVSDGFNGYGDFLFALKLSEQLRNQYHARGAPIPPIYLVSQPSGKETIQRLQGDIEFRVHVLTPDELREHIKAKKLVVGTVIEAPVFNDALILDIDDALGTSAKKTSLIMIPEYGYDSELEYSTTERNIRFREDQCKQLEYQRVLFSGFKEDISEHGILLSDTLVHPASPDVLMSQIDTHISTILLSASDSVGTQASTELSMQYSHDRFSRPESKSPATHFLNVHHAFFKTSDKNQDILMVGQNITYKMEAIELIKDKLIASGYKRISFFNVDTLEENVLHDTGEPGKTYRVIYIPAMSHPSMIACNALSGPLIGATGDQSLGEALSSNKLVVYECLLHKKRLIESYLSWMLYLSRGDSDAAGISTVLNLLGDLKIEDEEYEELGRLLSNGIILEKIQQLNKELLKKFDFVSDIFQEIEYHQSEFAAGEATLFQGHSTMSGSVGSASGASTASFEAIDIPTESDELLATKAILEGRELPTDANILLTPTGFYKLNPSPIGKGGWGSISSAQHYYLDGGDVMVSPPLAIKQIFSSLSATLENEHQCFQIAYPEERFESFTFGGMTYLSMPLFPGVQLYTHLISSDALSVEERQTMAMELLIDLDNIHKHGITHNDLKTKNILYDPACKKMHIIDFGCAQNLRDPHVMQYETIANSVFAFEFPPEYLDGTLADPSQDIYTMAPIIAEILGVDKKALVTARLNTALEAFAGMELCDVIKSAFDASDTIEEALFTSRLYAQRDESSFGIFVEKYVATPYDFSPYQHLLGDCTIDLLHAMQAIDPKDRPNTEECLLQLRQAIQETQVPTAGSASFKP